MNDYYVMHNGAAWFVKTANFSLSKAAISKAGGKNWRLIWADSIEHARLKAAVEFKA